MRLGKNLWMPDLYFYTRRKMELATILGTNRRVASLRIEKDESGATTISYIFQARLTIECSFSFVKYPMDKQVIMLNA